MSVEDSNNIDKEFNRILKEEYKQHDWLHITIPAKIVAVLCYGLPMLLMINSLDYHKHDLFSALFLGTLIGTGFWGYYRYHKVAHLFFANNKPLSQVIKEVRQQEELDKRLGTTSNSPEDTQLTQVEESEWDKIVSEFERSLGNIGNLDPEHMNLSTLFDRGQEEPATVRPVTRTSWFKRLFRRN